VITRQTVERIVADMFVNGAGQKANWLVLTTDDGHDLGGWSRRALVTRILKQLRASEPKVKR